MIARPPQHATGSASGRRAPSRHGREISTGSTSPPSRPDTRCGLTQPRPVPGRTPQPGCRIGLSARHYQTETQEITPRRFGVIRVIEDQITTLRPYNARYTGDHRSIFRKRYMEMITRVSLDLRAPRGYACAGLVTRRVRNRSGVGESLGATYLRVLTHEPVAARRQNSTGPTMLGIGDACPHDERCNSVPTGPARARC
jgi:hypothetical protein